MEKNNKTTGVTCRVLRWVGRTNHTESGGFIREKLSKLNTLSEFAYYDKLQGNLIAVLTNSLVLSYLISIQGTLVIWKKYFLQKLNFPQYVSMKCRPPAVNIITTNLNSNISQRFVCYISPKVPHVQFSLYKSGCSWFTSFYYSSFGWDRMSAAQL